MVEITPEMQVQLDQQKADCIFCKIIAGEQESQKVYEDDKILAILDVNPTCKGHILILPKEHYPIMPYLPPETFKHMFGIMPKLIKAVKKATINTGANIIIANGAVAGQKAPHFLVHMFPRENGDNLDNFEFSKTAEINNETNDMLAKNIPIMMQNHFQRTPAAWKRGSTIIADHLQNVKGSTIYTDEKVHVIAPEKQTTNGHLAIYSNEAHTFEELDAESAAHMFFAASYGATAVFEGMQAHGSNIILKTGESRDNSNGLLSLHVLPRFNDDGITILNGPLTEKPDLNDIQSKIKGETFILQNHKGTEKIIINLDEQKIPKLGEKQEVDEITAAINIIKGIR